MHSIDKRSRDREESSCEKRRKAIAAIVITSTFLFRITLFPKVLSSVPILVMIKVSFKC